MKDASPDALRRDAAHPPPDEPGQAVADRLRTVAAAAGGVVGAASPDALRAALEAICRRVLPFEALSLLAYDGAAQGLGEFGRPGDTPAPIALAGAPWEAVVQERRSRIVEGPAASAPALLVPALAGKEVLGVLALQRGTGGGYTADDVEVAELVAALAAPALAALQREGRHAAEERRAAEQARRLSATRFRAVFEQFPLSMQLFDAEGWTLDVNRAWEALFGGTRDQLQQARFNPLRDPQLEDVRALLLRGFAGETVTIPPHPFDPGRSGVGGGQRWLEVTVCPVRDDAGAVGEVIVVHRDVTELVEAEGALRASEESYRTIFDAAGDAIYVHDVETGAILDANRQACELHGRSLDELKAIGVGELSGGGGPFDDEHALAYLRRAAAGEPQRFEWRAQRTTGEERWVEVSLQRVPIRGVDRILATVRDVDARRRAEAALEGAHRELEARVEARTAELAQAEGRFRAIVEASPTPLLLSRVADGVILYANDRLEALIGAEPGSLAGRVTPDFYWDPADRPHIMATIRDEGYVRDLELRVRRTDGTHRWVSLTVQRMLFDGEPTLAASLVDITERKGTEEALRTSEASYRGLFDTLTELVYIQDLEGRFVNVNEAVVRAYGYAREEVVGQTPAMLAAPGTVDPEAFAATFARAVAGEPQRFEWWGRRKDGSTFPKEVVIQRSTYFGQDVVIAVARDVTERKEAEAALRRSEEHFRRLIENASDIITILDAEGVVRYQTPALTRMLGYGQHELDGHNVFDLIAPEDVAPTVARLQQIAEHPGTAVTAEFRFRHKDGSWRVLEAVGTTLSPTSAVEGVVVNSRDVTERRAAEAARRESEALKQGIVASALDCIISVDGDGVVVEFNPAAERTFGHRAEDAVGRPMAELIVPHHLREAHAAGMHRYRTTGERHVLGQRIEVPALRADGTEFPAELAIDVVHLESGREVFTAYLRDITERKAAEAALRRSEEHFRRLIENASDLITIIGPDGVSRYQSPSFERVLGYAPEERTGTSPFELIHPDDVAATREVLGRMMREPGRVQQAEFRYRHRDGSWRVFEATGRTLLPDSAAEGVVINSRDVTERREAEAAVRRSEEHFRRLTENASDLVQVVGPTGEITYTGPSVRRLLGYAPEEIAGASTMAFIHPDDHARVAEEIGELLANPGTTRETEYRVLHKDGRWRTFEARGRTLLPNSAAAGFVVNARDVTERKVAETRLRESEEHFRRLIENGSDVITILDARGVNLYQSPSVERVLGYAPEELVGRNAFDWIHPDDAAQVLEGLRFTVGDPGSVHGATFRFRHRDGSWRVLEAKARTLLADGPAAGVVVTSRDVTERVEAERALRLQKTLLEAEGEASIDGILVVSEAGGILSFNRRFVEMWALPPDVVATRSDTAVVRAVLDQLGDPEEFLGRIAYLYAHPHEVARDEVALRDGRVFDRYSAPVVSSEGEYYGRIWFFRDITATKRHAEELDAARREAERALAELQVAQARLVQQEKLASLGRLTAGIAHELRNPLNFVNNFSALQEELADELVAEMEADPGARLADVRDVLDDLRTNAAKVHEHGQRADAIVRGMMEHTRGGSDERAPRLPLDLNVLVEETVELVGESHRRRAPGVAVHVVRDYGAEAGAVLAVPQELGRVVQSLLSNAFDAVEERAAAPAGGTAGGPAGGPADEGYEPAVTVRTWRAGDLVHLAVTDNGRGIPAEVRDRIFEPFFTTKGAGSGHPGLGLSLAHETAVTGYGGRLEAESAPGAGATFTLTLPAA